MQGAHERGLEGLQRLADTLSDGIAVCRGDRVVWANRRLAELAGRRREALMGRPVTALLPPGTEPFEGELETRVTRPDGSHAAVRVTCRDEPGATVWIFRDLGRAGSLEAEVLALGRALREANLELESLRERARQRQADLDEVLTVVSHELRTPVTVITGYARLLLSERVGALNDEQRHFVEESVRSCRRLNAFIANLLENSREVGGDAPLQVHEAPVEPTLESVLASFKPLLDERGIVTQLDLHPEAPAARFDPLRIEQVLSNLLENAIKYGPPGGRLWLATRRRRERGRTFLEISLTDQGEGIPEADRERVFERYVRVGEQSGAGGLGLGLALCRRAVEAHGGVIGVTDAEGGGARFWFTLPAASEPAQADAGSAGVES